MFYCRAEVDLERDIIIIIIIMIFLQLFFFKLRAGKDCCPLIFISMTTRLLPLQSFVLFSLVS